MTQPLALRDAAHRVPSASPHVRLSILNIQGPEYAVTRCDQLRISLNIGPAFNTEADGSGGERMLFCRRNGLLITPPHLELRHRSTYMDVPGRPAKPARLVVFVISMELLAASFIERGIKRSDVILRHQAIEPNSALLSLAQALLADLSEGSPDGPQETEFLAMALVARISRQLSTATSAAQEDNPLERVQRHIESHLHLPLSLADLADLAGMSQFHFCRLFRDATGSSPHQFILNARIETACRLLWNSGTAGADARSILDIALACGFGSSSHFSTQFRRHKGLSPLQWRTLHR